MSQIKHAEANLDDNSTVDKDKFGELNFVKRSNSRLTNTLIKSIMEKQKNSNQIESSPSTLLLKSVKNKISKKNKTKLKKLHWHDSRFALKKILRKNAPY